MPRTLADDLVSDVYHAIAEDHFGIRANYYSQAEGTKSQILVLKEETEGGVNDQSHTRQNIRLATFHVIENLQTGVLQPLENDRIDIVEGGETVTWTLAKNGIIGRDGGSHMLKFTTITQLKQGRKSPNAS